MKRKSILGLLVIMILLTGCASNVKKGVSCLEEGNYAEAVVYFEAQLEEGKDVDEANRGLGIAYYELGIYMEAFSYFNEALANGTEETASIYHLMGTCCMHNEDYVNAISYYDKALGMEDCSEEMKQEMMFNKIAAYEEQADWESAKNAVSDYLALYPEDERAVREAQFLETR